MHTSFELKKNSLIIFNKITLLVVEAVEETSFLLQNNMTSF